ncbi:MAG TPA: patatin-like phospholipase family protein [Candidatus Deferrimicrobium sp.]|nr:patatin-like phospholipase family protein [Candidatus Deferrimicrobium sp.]
MKALVLSGGASKGAFTAGVVEHLLRVEHMTFDFAVGTSTGSLVGGPALLNDYNYLSNIYTTVANDDILDNSFLGSILDSPIGAKMDPLHRLLRKYYIDQHRLEQLTQSGKTLVITIVNVRTGKIHMVSTRSVAAGKIAPTTFVKAILASCSEPVFTEPVRVYEDEVNSPFRHDLFYDGGVKEFLPLQEAVVEKADEIWAVSTHRLEHSETPWGGGTAPDKVSIIKALLWTIGSTLDEVARGDRYHAQVYLRCRQAVTAVNKLAADGSVSAAAKSQLLDAVQHISDDCAPPSAIYMIYPDISMHTSLEFNETVMMGYLRAGQRAAAAFIAKNKPMYADDTLKPWDHQEPAQT